MEPTPAPESDTKPCPVCGETIKAVAIKCRFCGEDLAARAEHDAELVERDLFVGRPAVLYSVGQWAVVVLTLGIAYLYFWLQSAKVKFHVSTQRIKIEHGVLSKTTDTVELFRVEHFDFEQPFGMRLVGQSVLLLRSSDPDFETVRLYAIPGLQALGDKLRECSLRERKRRSITTFVNA